MLSGVGCRWSHPHKKSTRSIRNGYGLSFAICTSGCKLPKAWKGLRSFLNIFSVHCTCKTANNVWQPFPHHFDPGSAGDPYGARSIWKNLNFFFRCGRHRQPPKMDGCPFSACVALAIPTTKHLKTYVAAVTPTKKVSEYIHHMRGHVLKFYWDIQKLKYIENHSFTVSLLIFEA